jgi:hypothetical protein
MTTVAMYKKSVRSPGAVMFSAAYDDGREAYFVVERHGSPERDFLALPAAQERQRRGELPEGVIVRVKRVR